MRYRVGYGTATVTEAGLRVRPDVAMLDGEFLRRLIAFMDASDGRVGIGGGGRSEDQQEQLFRSRYHVVGCRTPSIKFDGKCWSKNDGVESAAPPGLSYHEETTKDRKALAADMTGWSAADLAELHRFGLRHFAAVNGEPWHWQPVEIPASRREYAAQKLARWTFPSETPAPTPPLPPAPPAPSPQEFDDMQYSLWFRANGDGVLFTLGAEGINGFGVPPEDRATVAADYGITARQVSDLMWADVADKISKQLAQQGRL